MRPTFAAVIAVEGTGREAEGAGQCDTGASIHATVGQGPPYGFNLHPSQIR